MGHEFSSISRLLYLTPIVGNEALYYRQCNSVSENLEKASQVSMLSQRIFAKNMFNYYTTHVKFCNSTHGVEKMFGVLCSDAFFSTKRQYFLRFLLVYTLQRLLSGEYYSIQTSLKERTGRLGRDCINSDPSILEQRTLAETIIAPLKTLQLKGSRKVVAFQGNYICETKCFLHFTQYFLHSPPPYWSSLSDRNSCTHAGVDCIIPQRVRRVYYAKLDCYLPLVKDLVSVYCSMSNCHVVCVFYVLQ